MKLFLSAAVLMFLTIGLSVSVFAQRIETQAELFGKISALTKTKKAADQDKAYELSKTFLAKFGKSNDEDVKKVREFVENHERVALGKMIDEGKTAEVFALGKEILAQNPDNSYVSMMLAYAGYQALQAKKDKSFAQNSTQYAKQTLQLFEQQKLPKSFHPFTDQNEATASMYYFVGKFTIDSDPKGSAKNFYKSVQYDSEVKNDYLPYYVIALFYEKEFAQAAKDFETKHGLKTNEDAEMKADNAKIEKMLAGMQDAYARAVRLGETANAPGVNDWKVRYIDTYKFIKGTDAGSVEFLANVLTTPMPDPVP